jgi:hypothetical protein
MQDEKSGPFIIGFNGPPRSGKDTIANALVKLLESEGVTSLQVHKLALAATMRDGAAAILGMNLTDKQYSDIKDKPLELLGGKSFRKFMIDMSEVFVKGVYGGDFWSRLMYARNRMWWDRSPAILIVTDIGFSDEVEFFCNHSVHYLNVAVSRKGTDFSLDSRSYVWCAPDHGGANFALDNNGTPEEAAQEVARIMYKFGVPVF